MLEVIIIRKDKRISYFVYFSIITLLYVFILAIFISNYYQQKDEYYSNRIDELNYEMDSTLYSYGLFSNYIYENYIEIDYVLDIVDTAYEADEATQDTLRTELYNFLINEYSHVVEYDFRQVHFHFPDSTSFLRMHSPSTYGDSLYDARYSVNLVNAEHIKVAGFEEGRVFNGYRFVYPLSRNGEHIGSVEVSVALTSVINALTKLTDNDYYFVISKDVVFEKVYDEYLDNYEESIFSEDFFVDLGTVINCEERNLIEECDFDDLLATFTAGDVEPMRDFDKFGFSTEYEGEKYEVIFTPITNIEGESVAYFISITKDNGAFLLYQESVLIGILITAIYIGGLIITWVLIRNRNLLKLISYSDGLTNIYNRRKFEIDLNYEISRNKRYPFNLGFIMFDIDHFKKVNDTFGHAAGDYVLETLAKIVKNNIREDDCFARYGGEEFVIMLLNSNKEATIRKAEEIRVLVENYEFIDIGQVTISLGVYEFKEADTYEDITEKVDNAMYESKETGRNKVSYYD